MAAPIPSAKTPYVPLKSDQNLNFGQIVNKLRALTQSSSSKTPSAFMHSDWKTLSERIPYLLSEIKLKAPEKIKKVVLELTGSLMTSNEIPEEWDALKHQIDHNQKKVAALYQTFISMDRSAPATVKPSSPVNFSSNAEQSSRAVQVAPKMPITLAYLVQILKRISNGEYGEILKEALENRDAALFSAQTLCKLVLFEASHTLPIPAEFIPEITILGNKYADRLDEEYAAIRKNELLNMLKGITSDNDDDLEIKFAQYIKEHQSKKEEWNKIKKEFPAKLQELTALLNQTKNLESLVFQTEDQTLANQVVSTLQLEHTREEFLSMMNFCNQTNDLSELTNAFPNIPSLVTHFRSIRGEESNASSSLRNMIALALITSLVRNPESGALFSEFSDEEEDLFFGTSSPASSFPVEHVVDTTPQASNPLSTPRLMDAVNNLIETLGASRSTPRESVVFALEELLSSEHNQSMDVESNYAIRDLYTRFKERMTQLQVGTLEDEKFFTHAQALLQLISQAVPPENLNGIHGKINSALKNIKKRVCEDVIEAYGQQPLSEITIGNYKDTLGRLHAFNHTVTLSQIDHTMQHKIHEYHETSELILLSQSYLDPSSATSSLLQSKMKMELEKQSADLHRWIDAARADLINYRSLGEAEVISHHMNELFLKNQEIEIKLMPENLNQAVRVQMAKNAAFYKELSQIRCLNPDLSYNAMRQIID